MKENKQIIVPAVKKPSYEPVTVQVNEIATIAVLCASGGGASGPLGAAFSKSKGCNLF